jgi:hypothetical protein
MTRTVTALDHHRNGVCGEPFYVAIVKDEDGSEKVVIRFPDQPQHHSAFVSPKCAVLDLAVLRDNAGADRIAFGLNSWRGDHYAPIVDAAIAKHDTP